MNNSPGTTPGKMQLPRALELLNAMIDHMIEAEGDHASRVIPTLLDMGFTVEELTEDFCFPQESVESEVEAQEEDDNGQSQ